MIELRSAAARTIAMESVTSGDGRETGGILLGHDAGERIYVTTSGAPGPAAVRTVDRFERDLDHAQALADEAYARDSSVWIGEWHTHPLGPDEPSGRDLRTYAGLLDDPGLGFARLVSLIVTPCPACGWADARASGWIVSANGARRVTVVINKEDADA